MTDQPVVAAGVEPTSSEAGIIYLHEETLVVSRRRVDRSTVRVATVTRETEKAVTHELTHISVETERVAIGRLVDSIPEVREEGDVTIIPIVEEIVVLERRLLLKEEVHVRRIRATEQRVETFTLLQQDAVITRTPVVTAIPETTTKRSSNQTEELKHE